MLGWSSAPTCVLGGASVPAAFAEGYAMSEEMDITNAKRHKLALGNSRADLY